MPRILRMTIPAARRPALTAAWLFFPAKSRLPSAGAGRQPACGKADEIGVHTIRLSAKLIAWGGGPARRWGRARRAVQATFRGNAALPAPGNQPRLPSLRSPGPRLRRRRGAYRPFHRAESRERCCLRPRRMLNDRRSPAATLWALLARQERRARLAGASAIRRPPWHVAYGLAAQPCPGL